MKKKLLSRMVAQFVERRQRLPDEILVHPLALAALALKGSVAPKWNGIPVKCRDVEPTEKPSGTKLGVTVIEGALRSFDL